MQKIKNTAFTIVLTIAMFLLPLFVIPPYFGIVQYNAYKQLILLSIGLVLFIFLLLDYKKLKFDKSDIALLIFLLFVCLSTIFSVNVYKSIWGEENRYEGLLTFITYFLIYYSAKYYMNLNKKILNAFFILMGLTAILGIMQYYNVPFIQNLFRRESFASSTFGNRNFYGSFIALTLPFSIYSFVYNKNKLALIASILTFYGMLATLTRSCWLAIGIISITAFFYILKQKNKEFNKRLFIIIGLFIMLFTTFAIFDTGALFGRYKKSIEELSNSNDIGSGRGLIWKYAFKIVCDKPLLGCGPDTMLSELFKNYYPDLKNVIIPRLKSLPDKAHNEFLHIACTCGIPALICYVTFLIFTFINLFKKNPKKNSTVFITIICISSYLIQSFLNISTIGIAPLFWMLLGYCYKIKDESNLIEEKNKKIS